MNQSLFNTYAENSVHLIDGTVNFNAIFGKGSKVIAALIFLVLCSVLFLSLVHKTKNHDGIVDNIVLFLLLLVNAGRFWQGHHKSLILDATGIRYQSGLPHFLQQWDPNWNVTWEDIKRIDWLSTPSPVRSFSFPGKIQVITNLANHTINASLWADSANFAAWRQARKNIQRRTKWPNKIIMPSASDWASLPLVQILSKTEFPLPEYSPSINQLNGFDLAKNSASRLALWVLACICAYSLFELFIYRFMWLPEIPWSFFAVIALTALAISIMVLTQQEVPLAESLGVSVLIGPSIATACFFLALRMNAWTSESPILATYTLSQNGELIPSDQTLPKLQFLNEVEYWTNQKPASQHRFQLYKGVLNFYELDLDDYHNQIRPFYEKLYGR
ncbi:MAG TPA: hypothetical protein VIF82_18420 [Burkholderiaceae bacterium]|jgi:hypothetical protein